MKRPKPNQFFLEHRRIIACCGFLISFIFGFIISNQFIFIEMNEQEYKMCEEAAYDIYNQMSEHPLLYEVPDHVKVSISNTEITVSAFLKGGKVIASLENNELVVKRDSMKGLCLFEDILMGLLFICIFGLIYSSYKEKQEKLRAKSFF